jgi:hypothetical protein
MSARDKSSGEAPGRLDAKIAKHRAVCVEFQQRADEVLTDMQAYTFAVNRTLSKHSFCNPQLRSDAENVFGRILCTFSLALPCISFIRTL